MNFILLSIVGTPLPYRFRDDDLITGAMLLSFLLLTWIMAGSWRFIKNYGKNFFRPRERENLFAADGESELHGSLLLTLQTCFLTSILFFSHIQEQMPSISDAVLPYKVLGIAIAVCLAYYLLKISLYRLVNSIFFERWQRDLWQQDYLINVFGFGLTLFPLTLLVVYFDLDYLYLRGALFAILIELTGLLFYRCARIFFSSKSQGLHLFLYFCTLEMAPLLFLWRILLFANYFLTTIY